MWMVRYRVRESISNRSEAIAKDDPDASVVVTFLGEATLSRIS
jgi:hypothetical protein